MIFREKKREDNCNINEISKQIGMSEICTNILVNRGYKTVEDINTFLFPSENNLHNPFLLKNMREVVNKILSAVNSHKKILIFGDYDVDGISAVSILYKYFERKNVRVDYFLPNRYEDGYGLTMDTADKVIKDFNPELVITVDCGISCYKEIEYLKSKGIDVIVTDHHEIPEILPDCLVLNAKIKGQDYPFSELCGAGMAFKIVQALGEDIYEYLPIAAIATVADIVSLTDENRAIVILGLKHFENIPKGIKLLLKELKINKINSQDIAFKIAPKLNAAGRMGDASVALQLFINNNQEELFKTLVKLTEMNIERQNRCLQVYEDATKKLSSLNSNKQKCIILQSKDWDCGLLGIVCARIVEDYHKPTFLFSNVDGVLKGSARSVNGINIHEALSSCSSLLETFGGHSMAAGLTLDINNYEEFKTEINNYFNLLHQNEDLFLNYKEYDYKLDQKQINLKIVKELDKLEPFGCDNPKPIFLMEWEKSIVKQMQNYPQHINILLNNNVNMVAFNSSQYIQNIQYNKIKKALVELQINTYGGKESVKCMVKNFDFEKYNTISQDMINGVYSKQLYFTADRDCYFNYCENIIEQAKVLLSTSKFGTLIVCNSSEMLAKFIEQTSDLSYNYAFGKVLNKDSTNTLVACLNSYENILNYNNVVFLEPIINKDYVCNFRAKIFVPKNERFVMSNLKLNTNREYFLSFYSNLKMYGEKLVKENEFLYYQEIKKLSANIKNLTYTQFICMVNVFAELGLITVENGTTYSIKIINGKKTKLENSKIYEKIKKLKK